jgi:hypothetical protein
MGAILSFLSGTAFRAIWGEFSTWLNAKQEHKYEVERMKLQGQLDAEQHARNLAAQRQQAELGYKTIAVQADADITRIETEAWRSAIENMQKPTGVKWIDGWNGMIRPSFASGALTLWLWYEFSHMAANAWAISAFSLDLIGIVIGFYFADRSLRKRGK